MDPGEENPFAALMSANSAQPDELDEASQSADKTTLEKNQQEKCKIARPSDSQVLVNDFLEYVFGVVVDQNKMTSQVENKTVAKNQQKISCVFLENETQHKLLSVDNIEEIVFGKLLLPEEDLKTVEVPFDMESEWDFLFEHKKILNYLFQCFFKLVNSSAMVLATPQKIALKKCIVNQAALLVCHPELYPCASKSPFVDLFEAHDDINFQETLKKFINLLADEVETKNQRGEEEVSLNTVISGDHELLCQKFYRMSLIDPSLSRYLRLVNLLLSNANFSKSFIALNTLKPSDKESVHAKKALQCTLLGSILSLSCLTRPFVSQLEFFLNPSKYSQQEHAVTERNLWTQLANLNNEVHGIIKLLLKQQETRSATLEWIQLALHLFADRIKMWTNEMLMFTGNIQDPSDGFMLNLSAVLLALSKPFCIPSSNVKLLKVDPRYFKLAGDSKYSDNEFISGFKKETFLIPSSENEDSVETSFEVNFMTECFFATHKSLQLGFRMVHERYFRLAQEMGQYQRLYEEAHQQGGANSDTLESIRVRMDKKMNQFLSLKTMLTEPSFIESMLHFHIATAKWLNNLAAHFDDDPIPKQFQSFTLPLPKNQVSKCLKLVCEFIVENVSDFIIFLRRFNDKTFALPSLDLSELMTMILILMGSPERLKNPHLRAKLAEMLEALMPINQTEQRTSYAMSFASFSMEKLFTEHPFASELIPTLVHVFTSIELSEASGENVAFEQKFGYRRPMYIVLKYLWSNEQHREKMKELAEFAEQNLEAVSPPLFLRFINFLMNDAVFLLDEALQNMSKIRELQREKETGEWQKLPQNQRQQNQTNLEHVGRMARFFNIMGTETIHTICWLTEEIKTIFCHKTLVDRIASMLNYFLLHLVGPQQRNFKVRDKLEYDFRPAEIVFDISKIYINLGSQENKKFKVFCLAIGRDDRSYSHELLSLASDVLIKTGHAIESMKITEIASLIDQLLQNHLRREISLTDVPEEYLDPIMSTLMQDPVVLPNSGMKVDRSTIARHLLSEQFDPFTRTPLTMDMVIPDNELKQKIKEFVDTKLKSKQTKDSTNI